MSSVVGGRADGSWSSLAVDGGGFSLLSGVAGVAPACPLADPFAKASANASSGAAIRRIVVSFWFDASKTYRRGISAATQLKKILKASKNLRPVTEGTIFCTAQLLPPHQHTTQRRRPASCARLCEMVF